MKSFLSAKTLPMQHKCKTDPFNFNFKPKLNWKTYAVSNIVSWALMRSSEKVPDLNRDPQPIKTVAQLLYLSGSELTFVGRQTEDKNVTKNYVLKQKSS